MTTETAIRPFEVTHRGILAIAVPMMLAYLSTPLLGIAGMTVIGRLGDAALLGGVALGAVIFDFIFATFNFLRSGTTGLTAQALGAGDRREIQATFFRALIVAVAIGLAVIVLAQPMLVAGLAMLGGSPPVQAATVAYYDVRILSTPFALANYVMLGWLIGLGRSGAGLFLQTFLNGLNIGLSIFFVMGLGWGVSGVAWGTTIGEAVTALLGLSIAFRSLDAATRPRWSEVLDRTAILRMVAVNRDIMIRSFTLLFAFAFFTARGAKMGDAVLAANAILMNLYLVGGYFLDGFAAAAEQYAGRAIGARYRAAFVRSVRLTLVWGYALATLAALAFWFGGPMLIDFMTVNEAVRTAARTYLIWAALTPIAGVLAFEMDGVFIGATWSSEMRNMMLLSLALYLMVWAVAEPAFGAHGLWLALLVFLSARGISLFLRMRVKIETAFA
ncbi:MATE family efflux transporter [Kaistia dalseonensis]|uniref:MATE family multidrug resistance protein n=1 Tax=Kaistia dalseonensis TaxID=410840 RepID=A0ABU0HDR5_9HYPH|nr:MATE family efflux transporter [Kaistia dalseonensis]MCX5497817.1 MATE family efflux transporter [Kaistia dalseonensis]MDQ0440461.1 MATE family multidrug resistance protein [Kaistia dalseonensis]